MTQEQDQTTIIALRALNAGHQMREEELHKRLFDRVGEIQELNLTVYQYGQELEELGHRLDKALEERDSVEKELNKMHDLKNHSDRLQNLLDTKNAKIRSLTSQLSHCTPDDREQYCIECGRVL